MEVYMKGILLAFFALATNIIAQNSAVSSHFNFGTDITGDITISEVRVPTSGLQSSTYYETLGFWGNKGNATGNGYGGIQESDDSRGNKVHIFSIWHALDNPKDTASFPYAVYLGYGMTAEYFGGEGVGLKTWCLTKDPNHPLYWKPDVWYSHVVRAWDEGQHTFYGFFERDGKSGIWRHLSTIGVREKGIRIKGANDAFLEDWKDTGTKRRETNLRNNWRRENGTTWKAAQSGYYSVNDWDLEVGKRSYNFRTNWDGGVKSDSTGNFYYMVSGGVTTAPTSPLAYPSKTNNTYPLVVSASKPNYTAGSVSQIVTKELAGGKLEIKWWNDSTTLPQFSYGISIQKGTGSPLVSLVDTVPHARIDTIDISALDLETNLYTLTVSMTDIFDNASSKSITIGNGTVQNYITVTSPVTGISRVTGEHLAIAWESNLTDSVDLRLIDKYGSLILIGRESAEKLSYSWKIPENLSAGDYLVAIGSVKIDSIKDSSALFTITRPDSMHLIIPQNRLTVHSFDSQQDQVDNAGNNVIDDDSMTFWHTAWSPSKAYPHEIVLKIDSNYTVSGLAYLPRQEGANGRIAQYEIYVSIDGQQWGEKVHSGNWPNSAEQQVVKFDTVNAQYVKLVALSEVSGQSFTSAAELNLLYARITEEVENRPAFKTKLQTMAVSIQSGKINVTLSSGKGSTLTIYSLNGTVLFSSALVAGENVFSVKDLELAHGIYFLQIEGFDGMHTQRIMLK